MASPIIKDEELNNYLKKRRYTRQKVTKLCSAISDDLPGISVSDATEFLDRLRRLRTDLGEINSQICDKYIYLDANDDEMNNLADEEKTYEDKISHAISALNSLNVANIRMPHPEISNSGPRQKMSLPKISIPEYGHKKGENLQKFLRTFEAILDKYELSSFEKFIYLRKHLSGPPLTLVNSIHVDEQQYDTAKQLLCKAFDSELSSKYDILTQLAELKLSNNTEPYEFIGQINTILSGVKSLEITVSDVCQYFIWNSMNHRFQAHLVQITNKSKPSLKEIEDNIFIATERYMKQIVKGDNRNNDKTKGLKENEPSSCNAINLKN